MEKERRPLGGMRAGYLVERSFDRRHPSIILLISRTAQTICRRSSSAMNEAAERERTDGGDSLPVHACERGKASATRAEDGGVPAPLIGALADFGFDGDGHDGLVDFPFHHDISHRLALDVPFSDPGQALRTRAGSTAAFWPA